MKIAVDAMGGDNGSKPIIEAIKEFKKDHQDVEIVVFGKEEELFELSSIAKIVNAPDIVPMEAGALEVIRMKNSSMSSIFLVLYLFHIGQHALHVCGQSKAAFVKVCSVIVGLDSQLVPSIGIQIQNRTVFLGCKAE